MQHDMRHVPVNLSIVKDGQIGHVECGQIVLLLVVLTRRGARAGVASAKGGDDAVRPRT